ncbi:ABC transporter permease [Paratissierella segnis]|jgi:NitT/TauT family transport system permease protein|uniref:ABC transporter permease n=1 Tax=Paratissierella segnis TaxID=2763679 RepID=A0A926EZL7_9FIRM|nr:ABC transporter permease [Paratissierella segnis]MBC8589209.1 ABC transporter permease [Paratissierella segnis]
MSNKYSKEHEIFVDKIKREKKSILITQISVLIIGLLLWEIAAQFKWIDTFLTSSPSAIWKLFLNYMKNGQLMKHVGISVYETIAGFIFGTLLGIIIAILLWWSNFWAKVLDPYLVVLNSLPKTALAPIIIIWVGAGYKGIIVTAISISIVVTIMNMYESYKSVDEDKIKLLQTFGATKFQVLRKLILPASIPSMISTLKINIGLSWVGVIVGEFLVSRAGIGWLIVYGGQVFKLDIVMMSIFILGLISAVMYKLISILEDKLFKWSK